MKRSGENQSTTVERDLKGEDGVMVEKGHVRGSGRGPDVSLIKKEALMGPLSRLDHKARE